MLHQCKNCQHAYVPEQYLRLDKHYHGLKSWAMYQHVAHRLSLGYHRNLFKEFFGLRMLHEIHMFKPLMARYYRCTYRGCSRRSSPGTFSTSMRRR